MDEQAVISELQLLEDALDDASVAAADGDCDTARDEISTCEIHLHCLRQFIFETPRRPLRKPTTKARTKVK